MSGFFYSRCVDQVHPCWALCGNSSPYHDWVIFHYTNQPHLIYLFIMDVHIYSVFFGYWSSPVESFRHVWLFKTPWTAACQASLFIINSQSLFILMSVELVMSSNHLPLASPSPPNFCLSQLFPEFYPVSQFFASDGQSIGVSISKLVFPTNIQEWVPLGWTARIPLQSKGLLRVSSNTFSNTNYLQVKNIYSSACSFLYSPHLISIHLALSTPWTLVYICLCVNMHPHCPWVYN